MTSRDPLFKLRLPPDLRRRLENEAMKHARSLTAEILDRLEQSFPTPSERLEALATLAAAHEREIEALKRRIDALERRLAIEPEKDSET